MGCREGRKARLAVAVVVFLFWLAGDLYAGPVDLTQVQKATDGFLKAKTTQLAATRTGVAPTGDTITAQGVPAPAGLTAGGFREIRDDDGTLLAYIADLESQGFIALSADTDVAPVIAYSFRSSFPDDDDPRNPLYRMLRADMRLRVQALAEHPELRTAETAGQWEALGEARPMSDGTRDALRDPAPVTASPVFQQWPPEGSTATGGWLKTAWHQDAPYNQFCPADTVDGGRSYVGCAATALAQILNYHRQCTIALGPADAYTMYSGMQMDADSARYDFPSFADLSRRLVAIRAKYGAGADLNDVESAALSFACGVAMQMDYTSEGSGASPYDAQEAVLDKFGFPSADMFGGLAADSFLVLQENMINGLPALIGIRVPDGFGGHAVVCDGYNTEGEYHLNYGWGALSPRKMTEAWYRLPRGIYPYGQIVAETILNIRPEEAVLTADPAALNFYSTPGQDSETQTLRLQCSADEVLVTSTTSPDGFLIAKPEVFSDQIPSFLMTRRPATASILVKFRPQRAGGYYGTLAIHHDNGKVRYVILRGWSFDSGTQVTPGAVSGTWSRDQAPYFVTGNIHVPAGGALAIEPGVQVFFTGPYSLTIGNKAKLTAKGTAADPIELTAWNREVGWTGLRFVNSGADDVLSYCSITWARKNAGFLPTQASGAPRPTMVDSYGGAIFCGATDLTIENCRITNNQGDGGGAVYSIDSYPVVSNTLIANNTALGGLPRCGGLCATGDGTPELRNCTIVHNSPGGVFTASWDGMTVTNTIVWRNEMYAIATDESAPQVTFCDVQGGYPGVGNRSADPCFVGPSAGPGIEYDASVAQWALQSRSPCLNAGTDLPGLPATDIAGGPRIASGVPDLGAWESRAELPLLTITPAGTVDAGFVSLKGETRVTLDLTNTGRQAFKIQSLAISEGGTAFFLVTPMADRTLAPGESVAVEVAFRPMREVAYRGTLDLRSTAGNANRVQIALKGVGVSGTLVPGGSVSGTWAKAFSPYVVTGDIQIPRSKTLSIEPGVTVKFAGHFGLTAGYRATLRALGTEPDPIVFTALDQERGWFGIRLVNAGSDDILQYCTLEYAKKPRADAGGIPALFGGAILCYGSWDDEPGFLMVCRPRIESCRLVHNHARTGGAMAVLQEAEPIVVKNTFLENTSDYDGAAIALYYAKGTIANNVIARNEAGTTGGGIQYVFSSPAVTNNTFVYNRPSALHLESAYMDFFGDTETASLVNNIIWGNEMYVAEDVRPGEFKVRFNDIQGGWAGEGNIDQDPLFADPEADDYRLRSQAGRWDPQAATWVLDQATSPCIDAGDPVSDFAQEPGPNGRRIDLGAYGGTTQASKSPSL